MRINLQLFAGSRFHPEGFEGENPLLMEEQQEEQPSDVVEEIPIDDVPQDIPQDAPQAGQPVDQQTPELTEQPQPGEDIHAYLERMREDIISRLPQQEQAEEAGPSPEELAQQNEQWLEQFYENPMAQVEALAEQIANKKLEPIMKEREQFQKQQEIQQNIDQFKKTHPDMEEYVQDMVQIFNDQPELEQHPRALEMAYKMAKGNKFDSVPKSLDDHLKDEGSIDKLLENPEIKNKLIQKLMSEKQSAPPVMGTGGKAAGSATLSDPKEITNLRDATKAWMAQD